MDREIIENQRGRGYFVSPNATTTILDEMRTELVRDELPRLFRAMRVLDIGIDELADYFVHDEGDKRK
jgi:DNA-binding transcriptional regulator YhcF (GntR family)